MSTDIGNANELTITNNAPDNAPSNHRQITGLN